MKKGYLIILSALVAVAGPALADPTSDLARSYYDYTVAEYCGLITPPVAMGHALLHHDLIARGNISPETYDNYAVPGLWNAEVLGTDDEVGRAWFEVREIQLPA